MDHAPYEKIVRYIGSVDDYDIPRIDYVLAYAGAGEAGAGEVGAGEDGEREFDADSYAVLRVCNLAGEVRIPETATVFGGIELPVRKIGRSSFSQNHGLTKLVVPPSVQRIERDAFYSCGSLQEVEILEGDSDIKIGMGAFFGCENLRNVHLRRRANIGQYAFDKAPKVNLIEEF